MARGARTSRLRELQEGLERQGRGAVYEPLRVVWVEVGAHGAYIENHIAIMDVVEDLAVELSTPNPDRSLVNGMLERISGAVPQSDKKGADRVRPAVDALRAATAGALDDQPIPSVSLSHGYMPAARHEAAPSG